MLVGGIITPLKNMSSSVGLVEKDMFQTTNHLSFSCQMSQENPKNIMEVQQVAGLEEIAMACTELPCASYL